MMAASVVIGCFYTEVDRKHDEERAQGRMTWPVSMTR